LYLRKLIISSIIGSVIFAVVIQGVNLSNLLQKITSASPEWVILAGIAFVGFFVIRAVRWKIILANNCKFSNLFHIFQIGYLLNNVFPFHIGEVIRTIILQEKEKVDLGYGLSSIVIERIMDVIAILVLAIVVTSSLSADPPSQEFFSGAIRTIAISIAIALIVIISFTVRPRYLLKFLDHIGRINKLNKITAKTKSLILDISQGLQIMSKRPGNFSASFALTFVSWFIQFLGIYFLFNSIGLHIDPLLIFLGFLGTVLLLTLPSTPGYIGTYEGFWIAAFFALGFSNVDEILSVGILSHIISIAVSTCLGAVGLVALRLPFTDVFAKTK
jgi:hypothetical protein